MEMTLTGPIDGLLTSTGINKSQMVETETPLHKEVLEKEAKYMKGVFEVFGPSDAPKNEYTPFEPSLPVEDSTTLEDIKPALVEVIKDGADYWNSFKQLAKFSPPAEAQIALHERALGFLNGERSDTRSFKEVVGQMSEMMKMYSQDQKKDRVDTLYEKESRKSPLWLGKLAYTKIGVLWNVGGSQITDYQEKFVKHAERVKDIALRNIN